MKMKVLDPFAGYRLASGHPIFHLSLFCGSWVATYYDTVQTTTDTITQSFFILRWAHFLLFSLAICSVVSKIDSNMQDDKDHVKNQHRDGVWKIFGRICDTIAVFAYQASIMYVQMNVSKVAETCVKDPETGKLECEMGSPDDNKMAWLYIEMYCFYLYMASTVTFIIYHQMIEGVCCKKRTQQSDMGKTITDFIEYAYPNLIWFAFNFVLVMMPLVCIVVLNPVAENLDIAGKDQSLTILMIIVCLANLVQFLLRPAIFLITKKTRLYKAAVSAQETTTQVAAGGLNNMLANIKKAKEEKENKDKHAELE